MVEILHRQRGNMNHFGCAILSMGLISCWSAWRAPFAARPRGLADAMI